MYCCDCCLCFFFFKQKTAYEMRISDWSSDVCSSDLRFRLNGGAGLDAVQPETGTADAGGQACACRGAPGTWAGSTRPSPGGSAPGQKEPRTRDRKSVV